MRIADIFETSIQEKIEPVIKVGESRNEGKLAAEIGSYVVTPTIEKYMDDFLEHYTDTFRTNTTEIGVWISGYFGSGKSHMAKLLSLLTENRVLQGVAATKRFESRIPTDAPRRDSLLRSLNRVNQCDSQVLAFNLNTVADSKATPLPRILLSQYYQSKGYGANFLFARVIEAELDKRGQLGQLRSAVEALAKKPWEEIQKNLSFYAQALYRAVCQVAPDMFPTPQDVQQALKSAENGELYNVEFLVQTILDDLKEQEQKGGKPCRFVLVLDESGQWIEDDQERLAKLQAVVEEAASKGQGKIWVFVTTHEDMGSIYQNAKALKGDFKKIEGRFRFKFSLTTENIELVLEDRIFKKKLAGQTALKSIYQQAPGVLRGLGQLANCSQLLPECTEEKFVTFYPFFAYQVHLIPEIVKSLRSAGGRGEQLSGSTRTLLAITQDILRAGRRRYLEADLTELVSFDEVYGNLAGEGEVTPDIRRDLARIEEVVPGATSVTRRVAEVLYLIREIAYIPRTIDNVARLLVSSTDEDLSILVGFIKPELEKLKKAKLVAEVGEEWEFLTGERRSFEEEVISVETQDIKWPDLAEGLAKFASTEVIGFETVPYKGHEFQIRTTLDGNSVTKDGPVEVRISSPLTALAGLKISELENTSLRPDERDTVFVWCPRATGLDRDLKRYLAMKEVIKNWKGDPHKSEEARRLATDRETNDLKKLSDKIKGAIQDGLREAHVIFRGSSRPLSPRSGSTPGAVLRSELTNFWPTIYSKFDRVPVRINQDQKAIIDVLTGSTNLSADVQQLALFDKAGQLNAHSPLLDTIRMFLQTRQARSERTLGKDLLAELTAPPYGWDPAAIRVGVAALVRSSVVKVLITKKPYTNPLDADLQDGLRASRNFDKVELVLEETEIDADSLTEVRSALIKLTGVRKLDETPAALSAAVEEFTRTLLDTANALALWAQPADFPLPTAFSEGKEAFTHILGLANPIHRVNAVRAKLDALTAGATAVRALSDFQQKSGEDYVQMREFASKLTSIKFRLAENGAGRAFLAEYETAREQAQVVEPNVWKNLKFARGQAEVELNSLLVQWKQEARHQIERALRELPALLGEAGLEAELVKALGEPLTTCAARIDEVTEPGQVAFLPSEALALSTQVTKAIAAEQAKRLPSVEPQVEKVDEEPTTRPVRRVRLSDVVSGRRIRSLAEWEKLKELLDAKVKAALETDGEVEIE